MMGGKASRVLRTDPSSSGFGYSGSWRAFLDFHECGAQFSERPKGVSVSNDDEEDMEGRIVVVLGLGLMTWRKWGLVVLETSSIEAYYLKNKKK
jgi:hypothetical protein